MGGGKSWIYNFQAPALPSESKLRRHPLPNPNSGTPCRIQAPALPAPAPISDYDFAEVVRQLARMGLTGTDIIEGLSGTRHVRQLARTRHHRKSEWHAVCAFRRRPKQHPPTRSNNCCSAGGGFKADTNLMVIPGDLQPCGWQKRIVQPRQMLWRRALAADPGGHEVAGRGVMPCHARKCRSTP